MATLLPVLVTLLSLSTSVAVHAAAAPRLPADPPGIPDPAILMVCEKGTVEICGNWRWNRATQQFDGTWGNGAQAKLKLVRLGAGSIILARVDDGGVTIGLAGLYIGKVLGAEPLGDVPHQRIGGTVTWHFPDGRVQNGTWYGLAPFPFDLTPG